MASKTPGTPAAIAHIHVCTPERQAWYKRPRIRWSCHMCDSWWAQDLTGWFEFLQFKGTAVFTQRWNTP